MLAIRTGGRAGPARPRPTLTHQERLASQSAHESSNRFAEGHQPRSPATRTRRQPLNQIRCSEQVVDLSVAKGIASSGELIPVAYLGIWVGPPIPGPRFELSEPANIPAETIRNLSFNCALCGAMAAHVRYREPGEPLPAPDFVIDFHPDKPRLVVELSGLLSPSSTLLQDPEDVWSAWAAAEMERLKRDHPLYVANHCRQCGLCYCGAHSPITIGYEEREEHPPTITTMRALAPLATTAPSSASRVGGGPSRSRQTKPIPMW